jgi:hypothetical protein
MVPPPVFVHARVPPLTTSLPLMRTGMSGFTVPGATAPGSIPTQLFTYLPEHRAEPTMHTNAGISVIASYLPSSSAGPRIIIARDAATQVICGGTGEVVGELPTATGDRLATFVLHDSRPRIVAQSTGLLRLFDGDTLELLYTQPIHEAVTAGLVVYHAALEGLTKPRIVSAYKDGVLQVLDGESGALLHSIETFGEGVTALSNYVWVDGEGLPRQRLVVGGLPDKTPTGNR